MRRILAILLLVALLLSGCGAKTQDGSDSMNLNFYYCVEGTDQLESSVAVESESNDIQVFTVFQLMDLYLAGPDSDHLRSPFPEGTEMVSLAEGESGFELTMNGAFFTLQGVELSIASYCLGKTICEYLSTDHIVVVDEMDRISIEIDPDNYLVSNHFSSESESVFTLYFPNEAQRLLVAENREVTLSENESQETYVLRQLLQGPASEGLLNSIPKGTKLLRVETEDGLCRVDFSSDFYTALEDDPYGAYTAIYSVVNTLTGLDDVSEVQLLRDGLTVTNLSVFSLEKPLTRYSGAIGLLRSGGSDLDINIYVMDNTDQFCFGVPVRVKQTIAQPQTEAVAQAAISFEAPQGFYNPIPYGTELLGISVSGNVCYVDVSMDFVPADGLEYSERAAVWALVTSLTDLDNISSVVLTIEGESAGLKYVDISEPLTAENVAFS